MPNQTISLKLNDSQRKKLFDTWKDSAEITHPQYTEYCLHAENCVITSYLSGKVVFQGRDAEVYASAFQNTGDVYPQAGSDEVGTGDYFGPVCVCAVIAEEKHRDLLLSLGIKDSKAIADKDIREAAPKLMKALKHSLLILPPAKYNEVHAHLNMNAVKAALHNQAYVNLRKKYPLPALTVIDQFTPASLYYQYIEGSPEIVRGIHFETKAENKYPAVACGSVIARYAFLREMDRMQEVYGMAFAKGAGDPADTCARQFVQKYGPERLGEVAKLHFKNTEKIMPKQ